MALQRGWVILGNQEQDSHRVEVRVWRLPLGQLDGCDAQGPDVSLDRYHTGQLLHVTFWAGGSVLPPPTQNSP